MAERRPLKYHAGQHQPFAADDTLPEDTLPRDALATSLRTCAGAPQVVGATLPLCAEMQARIEEALLLVLARLVAGTGIAVALQPDGTVRVTNTCCDGDDTHIET